MFGTLRLLPKSPIDFPTTHYPHPPSRDSPSISSRWSLVSIKTRIVARAIYVANRHLDRDCRALCVSIWASLIHKALYLRVLQSHQESKQFGEANAEIHGCKKPCHPLHLTYQNARTVQTGFKTRRNKRCTGHNRLRVPTLQSRNRRDWG